MEGGRYELMFYVKFFKCGFDFLLYFCEHDIGIVYIVGFIAYYLLGSE